MCTRGGESLSKGVLWPTVIEATSVAVVVILERSVGVEIAESCSISSLFDMANVARPY